jgi:hypothetical protein
MLSFVNSSIFIAEQWDNGPIVNRKVSQTIANGSFNITPICGTFPGSQSWKFGYIVPDGGKKRVHILLPGLDPAQNYEFVFEKTI